MSRDDEAYQHEKVEPGTHLLFTFLESSPGVILPLCLVTGAILGVVGAGLLRIPYWLSLGAFGGTIVGLLVGMLLVGMKDFIHEVVRPSKNPGKIRCVACKKKVLVSPSAPN